jgi:hypothetical protein
MIIALAPLRTHAQRHLKEYSFVRGVNHGMNGDQAALERDLGYAKRLNLNSTRIWLNYQGYERAPEKYIDRLRNHIRTSHRMGFSTMPILWNGNGLNPDTLKPEFRTRSEVWHAYAEYRGACIARANPYDVLLEISEKHKTGWYIFNLMISGYWGEVHGRFYPDGTIRDPAIIAAVMGFCRNRDLRLSSNLFRIGRVTPIGPSRRSRLH